VLRQCPLTAANTPGRTSGAAASGERLAMRCVVIPPAVDSAGAAASVRAAPPVRTRPAGDAVAGGHVSTLVEALLVDGEDVVEVGGAHDDHDERSAP
jgi:hypothetical protein